MQFLRDIWILIRSSPIAKIIVLSYSDNKYIGSVRMQISYNENRTAIVKKGICEENNITGAIVYIAISLAYLFQ